MMILLICISIEGNLLNSEMLGRQALKCKKNSSYKGTVGKIAYNLIEKDFYTEKTKQKWYTKVTRFNLRGVKCYLSPILDGYNSEVISYNTSESPNLERINNMLNKALIRIIILMI